MEMMAVKMAVMMASGGEILDRSDPGIDRGSGGALFHE
jgi:hypothetical protein